jgi:hypothetical protein
MYRINDAQALAFMLFAWYLKDIYSTQGPKYDRLSICRQFKCVRNFAYIYL